VGKSHDSTYDTHLSVKCAFEIDGVCPGQGGSSDLAVCCGEKIYVRIFIEHTDSPNEEPIDGLFCKFS
jgi:hypothetical protein